MVRVSQVTTPLTGLTRWRYFARVTSGGYRARAAAIAMGFGARLQREWNRRPVRAIERCLTAGPALRPAAYGVPCELRKEPTFMAIAWPWIGAASASTIHLTTSAAISP